MVSGQEVLPDSTAVPVRDSAVSLSSLRELAIPDDTTVFSYYLLGDLTKSIVSIDTLADDAWRMFDPARPTYGFDYGTTGNTGAAARPLWFHIAPRQGYDAGHHAFDIYKVNPDSLWFVRNERSFTNITYYQGQSQNESALKAKFGRTFAGGTNLAIEYKNINHKGQYQYQQVKHNALQFGLWVPMGSRYTGVLTYGRNTHEQEENGGIPVDTSFGSGQFAGPLNLPTGFEARNAGTRHADQTLQYVQKMQLAGKSNRSVLDLMHRVRYVNATYKFSFSKPDMLAQALFPVYIFDERGARSFLRNRLISNYFGTGFNLKSKQNTFTSRLDIGAEHTFIRLNQEPESATRQQVFAIAKLSTQLLGRVNLDANGALGLVGSIGEYRVGANGSLDLGKVGGLYFKLLNQRTQPMVLHQKTVVSFQTIWEQSLNKPIESSLAAGYQLPFFGLSAEVATHQSIGFIYYDTAGFARQARDPLSVFQLRLRQIFHLRTFYLDYHIGLQAPSQGAILHIPARMAKATLSYRGYAFKRNALLNTGVSVRINSATAYDQWQPATGQFFLQNQKEYASYPWIDVFFDMKVKKFRAFIAYENIQSQWKQKLMYQTAYAPYAAGQIRLGIGWRFSDENLNTGQASSRAGGSAPGQGTRSGNSGGRPF
jgi:Putative porin